MATSFRIGKGDLALDLALSESRTLSRRDWVCKHALTESKFP